MSPTPPAAALQVCPEWFKTIELAPGMVTPGRMPADWLANEWRALRLTDLAGCRVLDIVAYEVAFPFAAERAGRRAS
jgi:hypothetical protein